MSGNIIQTRGMIYDWVAKGETLTGAHIKVLRRRRSMSSRLFDPAHIKQMVLRNRFVRSATYDHSADRGFVTETQLKLAADLAAGGVGLIITGITYTHPSGQMNPLQSSLAGDEFIPGCKKLVDTVHERGAKVAVQLVHAGREHALRYKDEQALAPSAIEDDPYYPGGGYRAMTGAEIWEIIDSFGDAARRAREAGFDAVQVHGAHAYLVSQFLSPCTNRRTDEWGGSLENRLRFPREIYRNIRGKVGTDYPLLIKLGVQDGFSGGLEFSEGKEAALQLAREGYDALEISQGLRGKPWEETEWRTKVNKLEQEAYFGAWAAEVKKEVSVPVMMVGGLRTFALLDEVIEKGRADFVSLCRPFIREPDLINIWAGGNLRKARCISCNKCLEAMRNGESLHCPVEKAERARRSIPPSGPSLR